MSKIYTILLILLSQAQPSLGYRFICNGILANGEVRNDDCGVCDDHHAARWQDPKIPVVVDYKSLPKGVNRSDWKAAVKESFAAWERISGANLKFVHSYADNPREFGANDEVHEIFWITKKEEWRKLVGSGEFGTLGATLPRYSCGGKFGSHREIFDADLVLNGLPHINWQVDCHDEDCISIQTTLVHELGHFFGLDHPCLFCNTSIMSARAGFDLIYPVLDDMEGLRALYPSGKTGGFGFPCKDDKDCLSENRCVVDSPYRYCSNDCQNDSECQKGAVCKTKAKDRVCGFSSEDIAKGKKEGENCMQAPCDEPLLCAGASEPNFFCYKPCILDDDCKAPKACIKLEEGPGVCVAIKNTGEVCNHRDLCEEDLYCVFENFSSGFCYAPCRRTSKSHTGCARGEICQRIEGVDICLPLTSELRLDETSSGFNHHEGYEESRKSAKPQEIIGTGCKAAHIDSNNAGLFSVVLLLLIAIFAKRLRTRF